MSRSTPRVPSVVFVSAAAAASLSPDALSGADAIVLVSAGESVGLIPEALVASGRPLVAIADTDDDGAAALVAAGADDVLSTDAGAAEIARAVRLAVARGRRRPPLTPRTTPGLMDISEVHTAAPSVPAGADPASVLGAIGRLAGGVAHDFNNLLQVIGGNAEVLQQAIPATDPRHAPARAIVEASRHAGTLTNRLLAFGRRRTMVTTSFDLSDLVAEAAAELRTRAKGDIRVVTEMAADLPPAWADRTQLMEVVSSLADNAFDAMSGTGGTLTLSTDAVEVHETMRRQRPWLAPGRYLRLQVADTGTGLEEHAIPHLFEPFFTTKPEWSGYGLGLSSVYGIIKQSGGFVWVDSRLGEGTRVTALLPMAPSPQPAPAPPPAHETATRARIMLVEDDDEIRALLSNALTRHGFDVLAFPAGDAALADTRPFDMLVTDVIVPGMNGAALAGHMRRRHPDVPVLFISGDAGHALDRGQLMSSDAFLQKPFSTMALIGRIETMLKSADVSGR